MNGLLEDPAQAGLLSMGLRLLSTPGKFGTAFGQAGLGAMGDIQQAQAAQQAKKARALQEQMLQMQLEQIKAQQAQQQGVRDAARASLTPGNMLPPDMAGPTTEPSFDARGFAGRLAEMGDPSMLMQMMQPKEVEIKEFREIRMPDGSVQVVGFGKDGKPVQTGQTPFKPQEVRDFGGTIGGIDPITGKVSTLGRKTQTPDSIASNATTIRGQDMTDSRARELAQATRDNRMVTVMDPMGNPVSVPASQAGGMPLFNPQASAQIRKEAETQKARGQLATTLGELQSYYDQLRDGGGIVSQDGGVLGNVMARTSSTVLGQTMGGAVGTKNQQARDKIEQTRPLLLNLIKEATGMSAQQMNSNAEMQLYLRAATDPTLSYEANVQALKNLDSLFGNGKGVVAPGAEPGADGGGKPPRISSDDDYNALPSGATFIAPDGSTRRKP